MTRIGLVGGLIASFLLPAAGPSAGGAWQSSSVAMTASGALPAIAKRALPAYPSDSAFFGIVDVETVAAANGTTTHARAVPSQYANDALSSACVEAIRATTFRPPVDEFGRPYATFFVARFEFVPPMSADRPGVVAVRLTEVPRIAAPAWDSLGTIELHDSKEPGFAWPKPVREVRPYYTPDAMRSKIQGDVEMQIVVLSDGTVGAARVTKSLHPGLDRAALVAARYWLFEPAQINGKAVAARASLQLSFRLH